MKLDDNEKYGRCPICKGLIKKNTKGWYCSNYKKGCRFILYNYMKRYNDVIHLTDESVRKLLSKEYIKVVLRSETGRKYGAYVMLDIKGRYINFKIVDLVK